MNRRRIVLLGLGVLILAATVGIARLGDLGERARTMLVFWGVAHAAYLAAVGCVLRPGGAERSTLWIILGVGLLGRLVLVPTAPTLSEDVYRYLWDGNLVAHGVNPFPHAPSDPALERFRGDLLRHLNHTDVPTIYPPAAQLLFGAAALVSATPVAWKLLLLALEFGLVLALLRLLKSRGLANDRLLLYYWNPLVLVESFGSGHVDLAAAAFLVTALALHETGQRARAGIAFGLAVLTKYVPGLLIPWLVRRRAWVMLLAAAVTAALLTAPFIAAGPALTTGLRIYARHWEFNGALYGLLRHGIASDLAVRLILAFACVASSLLVAWKARSATGAALASLGAFLLLSPTVFPWYVVPVVALLPLHPDWGMLAFSGLLALSYLPLPGYRETGVWTLPGWIVGVEYGGLLAVWAAAAFTRRKSGAGVGVDERQHAHVEKSEKVEEEKR
jgi:alpha-1,6-mannosyltransferase